MDRTREDPTLRDYARGVWRRKGIVIACVVLLTAAALAYSFLKTPLYSASAQLIYEGSINVADPLASSSSIDAGTQALEIANVASVIASPELIKAAYEDLSASDQSAGFSVSSVASSSSSGSVSSSTVAIEAVSPDAQTAARAANAYATAFVAFRKTQAQERVRKAEDVIQARIDAFGSSGRQTAEYLTLQQRLQDLQILQATVTGNFRVLIPASVPTSPFTPKPIRNGAMGIIAGLIIGIAIALLVEQFDTRVRSVDEVVSLFDIPLLARVRKMSPQQVAKHPLVLLTDSRSQTAESIRKLRSNLEFANVDGDLRSLFITSTLQHEGKSVTVCNLALSLAASGNRVILVDGDLRRPQVHRYLELQNGQGLTSVLSGKTELAGAITYRAFAPVLTTGPAVRRQNDADQAENQLAVLTSGPLPPNPAEMIASKSFARVVAELQERFDLVIIDAPALLAVGDTSAIARCVDGLMFLVDLSQARRPLLVEAESQIAQMPCRKLGLVVLSPSARRQGDHYAYSYEASGDGRGSPKALTRPASGTSVRNS